ncbi:MAG: hypothetical protein RSE41_04985 [Clostridia bacterium]
MKKIGMIGYTDKVDLISSIAKILNYTGKNVLVIDATSDKKYKYIIPAIETTDNCYISQYNKIDFAVGFDSFNDVENYLSSQAINISLYDYLIFDIDNPKTYEFFRGKGFDKTFIYYDTSILTLKKNVEIINTLKVYNLESEFKPYKVLYRGYLTRASENYFNEKLNSLDVNFDEKEFEILEEEMDKMLYLDFQVSSIMNIKKHTKNFIITVCEISSYILEDINTNQLIKIVKKGGI